jgi:hypothetical protein
MASTDKFKQDRFYLKTEELVRAGGFTNTVPAFNNLYDVYIDINGKTPGLSDFIKQHGLIAAETEGSGAGNYLALFCSEAVLPGSQLATQSIDGLRQGVTQHFATYRRYPDINLTFYSQKDYYTNEVFNAWMEFISPTFNNNFNSADSFTHENPTYKRLRYPSTYKCDIDITAFSNDLLSPGKRLKKTTTNDNREPNFIEYKLKNAFPTNIVAAPLAYGPANLIKTTMTFKYDYFFIDRGSRDKDNISELNRKFRTVEVTPFQG